MLSNALKHPLIDQLVKFFLLKFKHSKHLRIKDCTLKLIILRSVKCKFSASGEASKMKITNLSAFFCPQL